LHSTSGSLQNIFSFSNVYARLKSLKEALKGNKAKEFQWIKKKQTIFDDTKTYLAKHLVLASPKLV
jgi:hypothetical protein